MGAADVDAVVAVVVGGVGAVGHGVVVVVVKGSLIVTGGGVCGYWGTGGYGG